MRSTGAPNGASSSWGLPISVSFLIDVTSYTFMALFVARLGEAQSAAQQIAANLGALAYMVPLAMSTAVAVVVGQSIGAGNLARARNAGWTGIGLSLLAAAGVALAIFFLHGAITGAYTSDARVVALATPLTLLVALFHVFDAVNAVAANAVRAYKKAVIPMVAFALALWIVGLGGGYVLAFDGVGAVKPLGAAGFWIGAIAGMALATSICVAYFGFVSKAALRR